MKLCDLVAVDAVNIIDAISVPDSVLGSPLGMMNGQVYKNIIDSLEQNKETYGTKHWAKIYLKQRSS